jgi:hypothetical protein
MLTLLLLCIGCLANVSSALVNQHYATLRYARATAIALNGISASRPTFAEMFDGMKKQRDSKKFVSLLKTAAHARDSILTAEDRSLLLAEIEIRYSQFDFSSLAECLWLISKMNFNCSDPAVSSMIVDIIDSLAAASPRQINGSSSINGVSAKSMARLLNGLVRTSGKWSDLPLAARELLLSRIATSIFIEPSSYPYIADAVWSLGKLNAEFRSLDNTFRVALMVAISNVGVESLIDGVQSSLTIDVAKLLYGLSQMKLRWSSDMTESAKLSVTSLLSSRTYGMNENEIVNSVYSLGKMECRWTTLTDKTQKNLLADIQRVSCMMAAPAVANTLWYTRG